MAMSSTSEATATPVVEKQQQQQQQQQQRLRQARSARRHSALATTTTTEQKEDKTNSNSNRAEGTTSARQRRRGTMITVKITSSSPRKVPLAWLSGTDATKMAFQARQHASKSTVRFHDEQIASILGRSVYDLTVVDKEGLWYTRQEIMAITKENNELSKMTTRKRFHMDDGDNDDDDDNNDSNKNGDCLRGLETLVSMRASLTKRFQRNAVRQAVLDEQRRQRIKGLLDADLIRKLSRTHSKESRELALLMGKADAEELQQQESGRYQYSGGSGGGGVGSGYNNGRRRQHSTASAASSSGDDEVSTKTGSSSSATSRTSLSSFDSSVMPSVNEVSDLMRRRSKKGAGLVISAKKVASSSTPSSTPTKSSEIPPMEPPLTKQRDKKSSERKSSRTTSPVKRRSPAATDDGVVPTSMVRKSPTKSKRRSSLDSTMSSIASEKARHRLTNTPPARSTNSNSMEDNLDMGKMQCRPRVMAQQWLTAELMCPINTGPCLVRYHDHSPQSSPDHEEMTTKRVINHKRREMVLSPIKKKSSSHNKTMTSPSSSSSSSSPSPYDGRYQRREIVVD
jgi:hypothetical protein